MQPAKRGPKRKKKIDPYPVYQVTVPPETTIETELQQCRDMLAMYTTTLMHPTKLHEITGYVRTLHTSNENPGPPPRPEELSCAYAMLAYSVKNLGRIRIAQFLFTKALEIFEPHAHEPITDYFMCITVLFLALFYLSNSDRETARYYLDMVGAFIQHAERVAVPDLENDNIVTHDLLHYRGLKLRYCWTRLQHSELDDSEMQLKTMLRGDYLLRQTQILNDPNAPVQPYPPQVETYLQDIRKDIYTGVNNHPLQLTIVNQILNDFRRRAESRCKTNDPRARGNFLLFEMVMNAFRIKFLKRSGTQHLQTIRDAADQIANTSVLCTQSYSAPMSAIPVIEAASVHLSSIDSRKQDSETNALIGRLSDELKSLHLGSGRHKRIHDKFQGLIFKMENVVRNYEEHFAVRSVVPSIIFDPRAIPYNFASTMHNFTSAVVLRNESTITTESNSSPSSPETSNSGQANTAELKVGDLILERVDDVEQFMHEFFGDQQTLTIEELSTDVVIVQK